MKKTISILIIILAMATTISAQSLSDRQKHLATIAALEAQGDLIRLEPAIKAALDPSTSSGQVPLTINEIKEAFSQLYTYTGFPRSLNALGVLSNVPLLKYSSTSTGVLQYFYRSTAVLLHKYCSTDKTIRTYKE